MYPHIGVLVFIYSLVHTCMCGILTIKHFHLHDYNVQNQWDYMTDAIQKQQPIEAVHIEDSIITQRGLQKLLQLIDVSHLRTLSIINPGISPTVVSKLLSHPIMHSLEELTLRGCNIQCQDLAVLQTRPARLTSLDLADNYISEQGFQYLGRLQAKLVHLNLFGNSLSLSGAVQAVVAMGVDRLESLNVGKTAIREQQLLYLLQHVNKGTLKRLIIRQNLYSPSFYKKLTRLDLQVLEQLDLFGLIIEQDCAVHLEKYRVPSLKVLNLHQNELTTETASRIITRANFPNLQHLDINLNLIDSGFYSHLAREGFALKTIQNRILQMDLAGLQNIASMDLTRIERLQYTHCQTTPAQVQMLLAKINKTTIRHLDFTMVKNTGDLWGQLMGDEFPALEELYTPALKQFHVPAPSLTIRFPSLRKAKIVYMGSNFTALLEFLGKVHTLAPRMEQLIISVRQWDKLSEPILNGEIDLARVVKRTLNLTILFRSFVYVFKEQQVPVLQIVAEPARRPRLMGLKLGLLAMTQKVVTKLMQGMERNMPSFIRQKLEAIWKIFNLDQLRSLRQAPTLDTLKFLSEKSNSSCVLSSLTSLQMTLNEAAALPIYSCRFPSLRFLELSFNQSLEYKQFKLQPVPYLQSLHARNWTSKAQVRQFFGDNKLEYLRRLGLVRMRLEAQDVQDIAKAIKGFGRLRQIDLTSNYLNAGVSFLFGDRLRLENITMNSVVFQPGAFRELCQVNFEFVRKVQMRWLGIDDSQLLNLIHCLESKGKGRLIFPKLERLDMIFNYLQTKAISALAQLQLPMIQLMELGGNKDPEIFNSIFRYSSSRRLPVFTSVFNYLSGIEPDLDLRNTRRLQTLFLQSETIRAPDLHALSKLSFNSLVVFYLNVEKIDECEALRSIRKMTNKVLLVEVTLSKSEGINSKCLAPAHNPNVLPTQVTIQIDGAYGEVRKFVDSYFNPGQIVESVLLMGTFVSDQKIMQMAQTADLSEVKLLVLPQNGLTDISISELMAREYPMLQALVLSRNQLTWRSFQKTQGFNFSSLNLLQIGRTSVGDKGIEMLVRNNFPLLRTLSINNADLTKQALVHLSNLRAPLLTRLDISCNEITVEDFKLLKIQSFSLLQEIQLYPSITRKQKEELKQLFRQKTGVELKITATIIGEQPQKYSLDD